MLLSSNIKSQPQLDDARLDRNIHPAPGNGDVLSTVHSLSDRSQVGKYGASGSTCLLITTDHKTDKCKLSHFHNSHRYEMKEKLIA